MRLIPLSILSLTAASLVCTRFAAAAAPAYQGFNYGSTFDDNTSKQQSDFAAEFLNAQQLIGAPAGGFTSARLYTTVQAGTTATPISAIPAALQTNTTLLLGLWASGGDAAFANEISALNNAIKTYGTPFLELIAGISVGSEDLYRISPIGILNKEGRGAEPNTLVNYIGQVRNALASNGVTGVPVGHVDTWNQLTNTSNSAVLEACDFIGIDAYPYFQSSYNNPIEAGKALFLEAYNYVVSNFTTLGGNASAVWITETGWPVSGPNQNLAVPSIPNAQTYWDQVGCTFFGKVPTWWFTMQDADPNLPSPSFGIVGSQLTTTPLFNISC